MGSRLSASSIPPLILTQLTPQFLDGLHGQRASIRHRLRTEALHSIADDVKDFATSTSRFDAFSELIGYTPAPDNSEAFYGRFEVPILYDKWDGEIDLDHLFRGDMLLKVLASIIRGPQGAEGLFEGKSKLPQATCLQRIHKITCITPGAIVVAATLAIWLFSADTQLVQVGDKTTIDYAARHRAYIRRIREGLRDKKAWAVGLMDYWNSIFFPNAEKSRDHDAAGNEQLVDNEEIDDIFAQASQVPSPPHNAAHGNEGNDDEADRRQTPPAPSEQSQPPCHSSSSPRQSSPRRTSSPPPRPPRRRAAGLRVNWRGR
ncbi:hypothetical protein B0H17DRAFT_1121704 [Mycena rosella]|uniref:Uncharacterized protein n=1 Tax=Mycena rosella TaxID=1033263 RepID=A0AAD7AXV8_MYCRO|nr:hypothetical protein B0H17DRAFT_1121704 [Mycena rosella]